MRSHGLLFYGMHESCDMNRGKDCQYKCFADLQHHIQQYNSEISKVFFRKKALQSDRRWWLSVFDSLLIQAPVRRTLIMLQREINAGCVAKDESPTPCSRYCYTVLNIFDAASAGWDPITSDDDLGTLLSGSGLDQELAKHIRIAREMTLDIRVEHETQNSFEFLRSLFEMDVDERVPRRASDRAVSVKDASATASQPVLSIPPVQTPQCGDSQHPITVKVYHDDSGCEYSVPPPLLPPTRFIPIEYWQFSRRYKVGTNKARATPPPQEYLDKRRLTKGSFSISSSSTDDISERTDSMSSVTSYSSINAAYGTIGLDSPGTR